MKPLILIQRSFLFFAMILCALRLELQSEFFLLATTQRNEMNEKNRRRPPSVIVCQSNRLPWAKPSFIFPLPVHSTNSQFQLFSYKFYHSPQVFGAQITPRWQTQPILKQVFSYSFPIIWILLKYRL